LAFFEDEHKDEPGDEDDFKWSYAAAMMGTGLTAQACFLYLLSSGIIRWTSSG
jgi:hypothetical protein